LEPDAGSVAGLGFWLRGFCFRQDAARFALVPEVRVRQAIIIHVRTAALCPPVWPASVGPATLAPSVISVKESSCPKAAASVREATASWNQR
jgi:hypothetical protein